jgi:hypothetical protein
MFHEKLLAIFFKKNFWKEIILTKSWNKILEKKFRNKFEKRKILKQTLQKLSTEMKKFSENFVFLKKFVQVLPQLAGELALPAPPPPPRAVARMELHVGMRSCTPGVRV